MAKEYVDVIELTVKNDVEVDCSTILAEIGASDPEFWANQYGNVYETTDNKWCVIVQGDLNITKHVSDGIKAKIKSIKYDKIIFPPFE